MHCAQGYASRVGSTLVDISARWLLETPDGTLFTYMYMQPEAPAAVPTGPVTSAPLAP